MQPLFAFFQAFIAIFLCSHKKSAIFSAIFITVFCHKPSSSCLQYTTDRACIPQEILKIENNLSFRHTLPPKIVIKDGTIWDGSANRLSNGGIESTRVMKGQTFHDQKNWVFDRTIPVEDVAAILYDGMEIPLQQID